jgi:prepilin-type processing-associated H-X9-DG protein
MKHLYRMGGRGRSAFTLLELLVVILIIIIVASILWPTIHRTHDGSDRVKCAANLKQIGLAIQLYCNENKGAYPRTSYVAGVAPIWSNDASDGGTPRDPFGAHGLPGKVADNDVTAALFLLVRTQDITTEVFVCPNSVQDKDILGSFAGASAANKTSFSDWRKNLSYSYVNPYPDGEAVKLGYKVNATVGAEIAIAADMNPGIGDNYDVTFPTEKSSASDLKKANSRNHQGAGQNVLYGDGHVDWQQNSFCGMKRDNIYTVSGSTDGSLTTSKTVVGSPKWQGDSVLLPVSK